MNEQVKKQWVEALRSGKYQQGREQLRVGLEDGYCCLGVLCDLHAQATGNEWSKVDGPYYNVDGPYYTYLGEAYFPPNEVAAWAGLTTRCNSELELRYPEESDDEVWHQEHLYLSQLNDERGLTFGEIAGTTND